MDCCGCSSVSLDSVCSSSPGHSLPHESVLRCDASRFKVRGTFIMSANFYRYLMTVRPATRSLSQTCYGSGRRALHRFRISPSLFTLRPKCRRKAYMFDGFCACRVRTNAIIPSTNAITSTSASTRTGTSIGANACACVMSL